jgi:hypothetical protein
MEGKYKRKLDQTIEIVDDEWKKPRKRFFKKIIFGRVFIFGLDEKEHVFVINRNKMKFIKSNVKNIFGYGDNIFGIDLDGTLFRINQYYLWHLYTFGDYCNVKINLRIKKMFIFNCAFLVNTIDGNTYYLRHTEGRIQIQKKFPYYFKRIIRRAADPFFTYVYAFIGVDDYDRFCLFHTGEEIHDLGRNPKEEISKLSDMKFTKQKIDDIVRELLYGKEEFTIDCLGEKIDVKMIYNSSGVDDPDIKVAVDRDGKVYFKGKGKYKFIYSDTRSNKWDESPYFIKIKPKTKKKQQDKLFNLLKDKKNCDLLFNFSF